MEKAIERLETAVKIDPSHDKARAKLQVRSRVKFSMGKWRECVLTFTQLLCRMRVRNWRIRLRPLRRRWMAPSTRPRK